MIVVNSALTLPQGNKTELPKKRLVKHHLAILRAEVVDDITPNLFACGGVSLFLSPKKRCGGRENSQSERGLENAVEENDRQVGEEKQACFNKI